MNRNLIILVCFCLVLVFGIGIFYPKYQELRILQKKIEEKRTELQYKEEYFSDLAKISEKLKEDFESLSKIDSALPSDSDLPSLFRFLQKISSENGLILKGMTPSLGIPVSEGSLVEENRLDILLTGSYPALKNFLSVLQKSARLIEAASVSFSAPTEGETFLFNLKIKTHSY